MSPLLALPVIPAATCPAGVGALGATALGATGLGAACSAAGAASGIGSAVSSAAGSVVGFGVDSVLDGLSSWVTGGATWLLGQIGGVLSASTSIDLGAPWFAAHYATMAALAGVVIVPLLLLGVLQALYRQSAAMLLRSVLVNVPLALLLTAVAVTLVQVGLSVTDSMCASISNGASTDVGHFFTAVTAALAPAQGSGQAGVPTFVLFLGGIAVVVGAVMVWIELLLRSAAVYVAVLFLPLALAALAWPAIAHWSRRLADTLAALVLSKLVIVAVLSLAVGALASGTGSKPAGADSTGGGFSSVLGGAALLLLAACAPWSLFRLLPFIEAGAVGHLEGLAQRARHQAAVPARGLADVALRAGLTGSMAAGGLGVIGTAAARAAGRGGSGGRSGGSGDSGLPGGPRSPGRPGMPGGSAGGSAGQPADPDTAVPIGWEDFTDPYRPDDWAGPQPWEPGGTVKMMPPGPHSDAVMARMDATRDHFDRLEELARTSSATPGGESGGGTGVPPGVPALPPGVEYVCPLGRPSGARYEEHLGRDRLGPVLISGRPRVEDPS